MKNKTYHEQVIKSVVQEMDKLDIDLYLILTSEGADPMTSFIPGVDTVGSGAFFFLRDGRAWATAQSIDAQDVEESGLFDKVLHYSSYLDTVSDLLTEANPKRIALNYSETDPFCDGLTLGRYNAFVGDKTLPFEVVSSDLFIPTVRERYPKPDDSM